MNQIVIIGNLGRLPDFAVSSAGKRSAKMSICTSKVKRMPDGARKDVDVEWHRVTAWDATADWIKDNLTVGDEVLVIGRMHYSSFRKGESKQYTAEVSAVIVRKLEPLHKQER